MKYAITSYQAQKKIGQLMKRQKQQNWRFKVVHSIEEVPVENCDNTVYFNVGERNASEER